MLTISGSVLAADPFAGTWKMNIAKSHFDPGPAPKSSTVTFSQDGDSLVGKVNRIDSAGKSTSATIRYKFDGKAYPYEGPYGKGTISITRVDERHTVSTVKLDGGGVLTQNTVISADGKTRTMKTAGTNDSGQKVDNTVIYER